ncbi:PAS domain-containing protein [Parvibaculum sp.]|uniref:PAS domain-containing protein n=1 Tax=Parvibaculum sp. TaxID=2024848 RepID=UPI002730572B|nr:PAS domain-containing protein [Parvibaculum sp.]MDP1626408.1 PAS domain-containing protein [Parvibaculum sp.]MDP2150330.1 PAS domain-containing protein [Parvibaculum sp.]MDP3329101.1 PAS domain-containing protein [Parvibaculum sp.]
MRMTNESLSYRSIALPPIDLDPALECVAPEVREGLAYWQKQAAGRPMPLRSDIRPEDIVRLLPHLCLFELRKAPGGLEIFPRLAGSKFEEVFGPIHNKPLPAVLAPEILERWRSAAAALLEIGAPLRATGRVLHQDKSFIRFEMIMAPLSTTGAEIDMLYLVTHFSMTGEA